MSLRPRNGLIHRMILTLMSGSVFVAFTAVSFVPARAEKSDATLTPVIAASAPVYDKTTRITNIYPDESQDAPVLTTVPPSEVPVIAETSAVDEIPAETSAAVTPDMASSPSSFLKMQDARYAESVSTPEWQSQFLTALAGNDGILVLVDGTISPEERAPDTDVQDLVTLDEAVAFALEKNFELKAAYESVKSAKWDKVGAYSQYLPTVNLDLAVGNERSRPGSYNDETGMRVSDTTHLRKDRTLSIRQPLIDLAIISDIISGHDKENVMDHNRMDTRDTIASDTVNSYLQIVQSRMSMSLADEYKNYLDNLGQRMLKRVEGGGAANADLDRIISRASIAESARVEAAGQYETNILEFQRLTGVAPVRIKIPRLIAPTIPERKDDALSAVAKNNPGYLSALAKVDLARADRNKAYSGLVPKVYAQYSSAYTYNAGGAADGNPVDGVYPTARTDSAMLVMQWALNGGTAVAGGLSGASKTRQMEYESIDILKRLEQGISTSYTAINATQQRLNVVQKTVEANERVVKAYEEQYKNGTRPLFDVLDAYEQLYNSRINMLRLIFSYTQATYQIRRGMGDIVPLLLENQE